METKGIWTESFKIMAFMVDDKRYLTIPMLCNLLQELAGNHANFHQLGYFDMQSNNRFWVLNRMKVSVQNYPKWQDEIKIATWVSMMRGPFSHRHFAILDKNGNEIASAFTFWVAIDASTKKPVRIEPGELPVFPDKLAACGIADKLESRTEGQLIGAYEVQKSDLDMVGHTNNVKYIEWVLDRIKLNSEIKTVEVQYQKESHLGEALNFFKKGHQVNIKSVKQGEDICLLKIQDC